MNVITDKTMILDFLSGKGKDALGRLYKEILNETDAETERCHDAVQWIWPLHEESRMAQTFPIVSPEIVEEAKQDPNIINNLRKAKERFEKFLAIGDYEDVDKQRRWCKPRNHNLLRVTRIIRCLRLFGLDDEALDFYKKALKAADRFGVGSNTYFYWKMAYNDEIWDTLQV
jgi:tetratricopeptide (TPR) repeat protein